MPRIRLLHWKEAEAGDHIDVLRRAGHVVEYDEQFRTELLKQWRASPPDAFVIDLSRLPSQGRELAIAVRQSPKTRHVPVIFCCGDGAKVEQVRRILPDAAYCDVRSLPATVARALRHPVKAPVQPTDMMNRYGSRTSAEKLGITEGTTVSLVNPPRDALSHLGPLPAGVQVTEGPDNSTAVTLCFLDSAAECLALMSTHRRLAKTSKLWFLWRKGGQTKRGDVTESFVRETGISLGLVDYKICSVSKTWSAMLFAKRSG